MAEDDNGVQSTEIGRGRRTDAWVQVSPDKPLETPPREPDTSEKDLKQFLDSFESPKDLLDALRAAAYDVQQATLFGQTLEPDDSSEIRTKVETIDLSAGDPEGKLPLRWGDPQRGEASDSIVLENINGQVVTRVKPFRLRLGLRYSITDSKTNPVEVPIVYTRKSPTGEIEINPLSSLILRVSPSQRDQLSDISGS